MRFKSLYYFFFYLIFLQSTYSQKVYSPFIENFKTEEYNLSTSNTQLLFDQTEKVFIGNLEGLIVKSGKLTKSIKIGDNGLVYQLYASPQNQIYFSLNKAFGYFYSDSTGNLRYGFIKTNTTNRIKRICGTTKETVFIAKDTLFIIKDNKVDSYLKPEVEFQTAFSFNNKIYVKESGRPLTIIKNNSLLPLNQPLAIKDEYILTQIKYDHKLLFMIYPSYRLFELSEEGNISEINLNNKEYVNLLQEALPYQAVRIDSLIALNTRKKGIIILNADSAFYNLTENNGLSSNNGVSLDSDNQNGLWATFQRGVSRIEPNSKWSYWNSQNGLTEYVNDIITANGKIYVTSTEGVFELKKDSWKKIRNFENRAFGISTLDSTIIFASPDVGLFEIDNQEAVKITNINNPWTIAKENKNIALVPSEGNGIYKLTIENKRIKGELIQDARLGTPYSIKSNNNESWISIKWEGLVLLKDSNTYYFNEKHGLPKTNEIQIVNTGDGFIFGTSRGFYEMNKNPKPDSSNLFIPTPYLKINHPILKAEIDQGGNIWYATINKRKDQVLRKLEKKGDFNFIDNSIGLQRLPDQIINSIYPDPTKKGVIWIAGNKGLYRYDENVVIDFQKSFQTIINTVYTNDSVIFNGFYSIPNDNGPPSFVSEQPIAYIPELSYNSNNIKFEFSSSAYTLSEKNTYSFYLEGLDNSWSNWTRTRQKEYSNLGPGTYTFHLRSKNLYETSGKPTSYTFTIIPPWYLTSWAKVIFVLISLLFIWFIVLLYSYRLRKHRKHLKLLVADRTFEVLKQKKEIEEQYQQLSDQTEKLRQQSEHIELKNKELEESQEEVLQINNQLEDINKQLEKKVEKRTAKIKSTLEKLKQTNKELDTFIYKASHDLKGPLSRILGLAGLAKIDNPSPKNAQYLEMIERTSRDMDLLLSKLTQVHEIFNQHPKIVPLLVEQILEEIKVKLSYLYTPEESAIVLENNIQEPIRADHQLFYTVLFNLIENSLVFKNVYNAEMHLVKITIFKEYDQVIVTVKDNGIGIEEDLLHSIFDMFYRASDQSKGSGLGLYLAKIAVEKMRGSIEVKSKLESYTMFTIKLPA